MKISNIILSVAISSTIGAICTIFPPFIFEGKSIIKYNAPLFPIIATAINNIHFFKTITFLFVIYTLWSYFSNTRWFIIGPSAILLFPIAMLLEIIKEPTSHNIWPFELGLYFLLCIPPCVGALIGEKRRKNRK